MLPKGERINKGADINRILKKKQFHFSSPLLRIIAEENHNCCSRLVVICSGKLGGSVQRNRVKRIITAMYSRNKHKIAKNMSFVAIPRTVDVDVRTLENDLIKGLSPA